MWRYLQLNKHSLIDSNMASASPINVIGIYWPDTVSINVYWVPLLGHRSQQCHRETFALHSCHVVLELIKRNRTTRVARNNTFNEVILIRLNDFGPNFIDSKGRLRSYMKAKYYLWPINDSFRRICLFSLYQMVMWKIGCFFIIHWTIKRYFAFSVNSDNFFQF